MFRRNPFPLSVLLPLTLLLAACGGGSNSGPPPPPPPPPNLTLTTVVSGLSNPLDLQRPPGDNRFFVPLTSMQRLNSGRDGWRLHLIAAGACRASVVVGDVPRATSVTAARRADKTWHVRVDGIAPPLEWSAEGSDRTRISLMADAHGTITATPGGVPDRSAVDTAAPPPDPPYTFAFDGGSDGTGCALVWLEIPFPFEPK